MNQQLDNFQTQTNHLQPFPILSSSTFPAHPSNPYNYTATIQPIDDLVNQCYNPHWITLQDQIHYGGTQQFLKRFYSRYQQQKKIKLLGEYYRFHLEIPRIFMKELGSVIEENVEEKRVLEYAIVTRQMETSENAKKEQKIVNTARVEPHLKIIKDIQLSYNNFEEKGEGNEKSKKKHNKNKPKQKLNQIKLCKKSIKDSTLKRNSSITSNREIFTYKGCRKQTKQTENIKSARQKQCLTDKKGQKALQVHKKNQNRQMGTKKSELNLQINIRTKRNSVTDSIASQRKDKQNKMMTRSQSKTLLNTIKPHSNLLASTKFCNEQNYKTLKTSASQKQFQHRYHTNVSRGGSSKTSSQQNSIVKNSIHKENVRQISSQHKLQCRISNATNYKIKTDYKKIEGENKKNQGALQQKSKKKVDNKVVKGSKDLLPSSSMFSRAIQVRRNK